MDGLKQFGIEFVFKWTSIFILGFGSVLLIGILSGEVTEYLCLGLINTIFHMIVFDSDYDFSGVGRYLSLVQESDEHPSWAHVWKTCFVFLCAYQIYAVVVGIICFLFGQSIGGILLLSGGVTPFVILLQRIYFSDDRRRKGLSRFVPTLKKHIREIHCPVDADAVDKGRRSVKWILRLCLASFLLVGVPIILETAFGVELYDLFLPDSVWMFLLFVGAICGIVAVILTVEWWPSIVTFMRSRGRVRFLIGSLMIIVGIGLPLLFVFTLPNKEEFIESHTLIPLQDHSPPIYNQPWPRYLEEQFKEEQNAHFVVMSWMLFAGVGLVIGGWKISTGRPKAHFRYE